MEYKHIVCPCCGKEVDIPLDKYGAEFEFNYSILINSTKEFFDLVDMCPECGYVELFDNGVSEEMKEYVFSDEYRSILELDDIETGLKKWILLGKLLEMDENYTESAIAFTKAYDYMELKGMTPDKRFIEKAASMFSLAAGEYTSFMDAILAVDALRRDGEFDMAEDLLGTIRETFTGELVDSLYTTESVSIHLKRTKKEYLEI